MTQDQLRVALAVVILALFAWMVAWNLFLRRRGVKVAAFAHGGGNWMQRSLVAGGAFFAAYLVARAWVPVIDDWVLAFASPLPAAALCIAAAGALVIAASQAGMGRSWRVGVPADSEHEVDALVTTGLHRFSRNPTYAGFMLLVTGAALAAPGPLSLLAFAVTYIGLTSIIHQEERYLKERFGERYDDYAARVRRWI